MNGACPRRELGADRRSGNGGVGTGALSDAKNPLNFPCLVNAGMESRGECKMHPREAEKRRGKKNSSQTTRPQKFGSAMLRAGRVLSLQLGVVGPLGNFTQCGTASSGPDLGGNTSPVGAFRGGAVHKNWRNFRSTKQLQSRVLPGWVGVRVNQLNRIC